MNTNRAWQGFLFAGVFALGYFAANFENMDARAANPVAIAKSYGSFKAVAANGALFFEDSAGTIRVVDPQAGRVLFVYSRN